MKPLLAKSYSTKDYPHNPPDYALLTQHSRDVAEACCTLAETVGKIALENLDLSEINYEGFREKLKANGWTQDWGKISSQFQTMLSGAPDAFQLLRHETISGFLLLRPDLPFRNWLLEKFSEQDLLMIAWAAMGHHRKFCQDTKPNSNAVETLRVQLLHQDFHMILQEMAQDLGLSKPPENLRDLTIEEWRDALPDIAAINDLRNLKINFKQSSEDFDEDLLKRELALLKGLGIAADVAASAVAKDKKSAYSLNTFILGSLEVGLTASDFAKIIGKVEKPYPFQEKVAASADSTDYLTFVRAGCGSGKSHAAYLWAEKWRAKFAAEGRMNFRLFFCLPTTGTTTEHFKEYALESGIDPNALSLTHSRSHVDLQTIAETAPQEDAEENADKREAAAAALKAERDKIEALKLWDTKLSVTTTDTVLGLMANSLRSVVSLPAFMAGAIVFDEIHAFDERLFGHLLVFLKNFPHLPILLMTASLPQHRIEAIESVRSVYHVPGDEELEKLQRYAVRKVLDKKEIEREIESCLADSGKVLWIRNRVDWANCTYFDCLNFQEKFPAMKIDVYHSRLKYKHRSRRHAEVMQNFKSKKEPAILVATQVAEMSLDISADLLISDVAPIPSLIQRMGRLNRWLKPNPDKSPDDKPDTKPALICHLPDDGKDALPYESEQLQAAWKWIEKLKECGNHLSQKHLADAFSVFDNVAVFDIAIAEENAVFFSGVWQTRQGMTRGAGYTINVILECDFDEWRKCNPTREPHNDWLREHEVAIPIKDKITEWKNKISGMRVAPHEAVVYDYDEETGKGTGAKWRN